MVHAKRKGSFSLEHTGIADRPEDISKHLRLICYYFLYLEGKKKDIQPISTSLEIYPERIQMTTNS